VQIFTEPHGLNEYDLSPSTTTLDELLLLFCSDEKVALFRATFDGEEAVNIKSNIN